MDSIDNKNAVDGKYTMDCDGNGGLWTVGVLLIVITVIIIIVILFL